MLDPQAPEQPDVWEEHISTLAHNELQKFFSLQNIKQSLLLARWARVDSGWVKPEECIDVRAVLSLAGDGSVQSSLVPGSYLVKQPHEEYRQAGVEHIVQSDKPVLVRRLQREDRGCVPRTKTDFGSAFPCRVAPCQVGTLSGRESTPPATPVPVCLCSG